MCSRDAGGLPSRLSWTLGERMPSCGGTSRLGGGGGGLDLEREVARPDLVEPRQCRLGLRHAQPLALAPEQTKAIEFRQGVVDRELDLDAEGCREPRLDLALELGLRRSGLRR